ncbi:MAG: hypothetical protein AUK55_03115 [Syntrophobacteraceae bacterium CG2_30_61_12]|nr:MAG: hypothetical protein AUK55_03115 [Syntrophobacteraceae bacterium CG2_30_61_12]
MDRAPLIEFKDVTKRFGDRTVLEKVNLKIYEGDVTTLVGLSGTGKSVMLKHIVGLLQPSGGEIYFRGRPLSRMNRSEIDEYMSHISYMFQNNALFDSMTVFDNVALPLRQTTRLGKQEIAKRVMARLEQTELSDVAQKYPAELSGGMRKRTALARALVTDPEIVLFDEPTTGQDPIRRNAILSMVAEYKKRFGFTAVLISHDIPDVFFISNRVLVLYDRRIVFQGTPEEFENFQHPFTDELLSSLESLQEELTGLYSRRQFKVRYQTHLSKRHPEQIYALALFTVTGMEAITARLGHIAAQELPRALGSFLSRHFGGVGGFSSRLAVHEYVTLLPYSDLLEAERIVGDFITDFQQRGIPELLGQTGSGFRAEAPIQFQVSAGLAQGNPGEELDAIIALARANQRPVGTFQYGN